MSRLTQDTAILRLTYQYEAFTLYGLPFQVILVHWRSNGAVLQPHDCRNNHGLGYFHFARRYFGNRCFFLFLLLLRCFSSEGWPPSISRAATLEIDVSFFSSSYLDVSVQRVCSPYGVLGLLPNGLSHSEISGSRLVCKSPELIAAYHVLRRLQEPRHPPCALTYFLLNITIAY